MKKQELPSDNFSISAWPAQVDDSWQEQLVLRYAYLSKNVAARMVQRFPPYISLDDLVSSGIIGLIDAIHKFDPSKHISFKTYARFRIKGAILDEMRRLDWMPRSVRIKIHLVKKEYAKLQQTLGRPAEPEEVAGALGLEMDEFYHLLDETKTMSLVELEGVSNAISGGAHLAEGDMLGISQDENVPDPFLAAHFSHLREVLLQSIEALPDKEKLLISLYYYEELTMKEIGRIMGYTESRISQLHTLALLRLRGDLQEYFQQGEKEDASIPPAAGSSEPVPLSATGGEFSRVGVGRRYGRRHLLNAG